MIAKGGRAAVAAASGGAVIATLMSAYLAIGLACLAVFLAAVFRDPRRTVGEGVVSPADGRVRDVDEANGYISIYLALRNVHVTRAPTDGSVLKAAHVKGRHSPAFTRRSAENERFELTILTERGEASIVEMVGSIARRIVPYIKEGQRVRKGDKLSLIRFGSRVDMQLPPKELKIVVRKGDKVRAGETTVAEVQGGRLE